jgi:hypothetical protein
LFDYPRVGDLAEYVISIANQTATAVAKPATPAGSALASHAGKPQVTEPLSIEVTANADIRANIEGMSEEEALAELMKELN